MNFWVLEKAGSAKVLERYACNNSDIKAEKENWNYESFGYCKFLGKLHILVGCL